MPTAAEERRLIDSGRVDGLRTGADQLQAAVDLLDRTSDPYQQRAASTQTRLSLLVAGEALRAAEASRLAVGAPTANSPLLATAQVLALIGDDMWDSQLLGPRQVGFPTNLLSPAALTHPPAIGG